MTSASRRSDGVARTFATAAALGYIAAMSLRDTLKKKLQTVVDRLSGEYSAGSGEIRPDTGPKEGEAEVKVTRARLRRPSAATEKGG